MASQALYGRMIAHPDWDDEKLIESSCDLAEKMIRRLDKIEKPKKRPRGKWGK